MAGDIIRFPGRSRITPDQQEANDSSSGLAAGEDVSSILRRCISAHNASLGEEGVQILEFIDPGLGMATLSVDGLTQLVERLLDTLVGSTAQLRVQASGIYQPEFYSQSGRTLEPGHYALVLFDGIALPQSERVYPPDLPASLRADVEGAGGRLETSQSDGSGGTVALHIRLVDPESVESKRTAAHILLVDDNEAIQVSVREMLERLGHQVTVRSGGVEALDALRRAPDDFQLLITDITMPRLSGPEMVTRLRAIRDNLPVVFMTGFSIDEGAYRALDLKAVLQKPFTLVELERAVRLALAP